MSGKAKEVEEPSDVVRAVPSFPRIVEVLYALTATSGIQSVRDIAEATGNSRSATQRILRSLADARYAEQRENGSYGVGPRLVELAARVFGVVPVFKMADSIMAELVSEVGETAYLATYTPGDTHTTFIHRAEADHPVRHVQALGVRLPLHAGAVGKAILTHSGLGLDKLELTRFTAHTLTTRAALRKELELIRTLGYATSFEERVSGVVGVAAPLFSGDDVVGGLSVSIPTSRVPADGVAGIGKAVRTQAEKLSQALTAVSVKRL